MGNVTSRVRRRIERDYPEPGSADEIARIVGEASDSGRVQAAIVMLATGDVGRLCDAVALTATDWRDALVGAGLSDDDWSEKLDSDLGPSTG